MRSRTEPVSIAETLDQAGGIIMALIAVVMVIAFIDADGKARSVHRPEPLPQPISEPLDLGL